MSTKTVKLRRKKVSQGRQALYLDIYCDGHRHCEYLHLFLLPDPSARAANRKTLEVAEAIRSRRQLDIIAGAAGVNVQRDNITPLHIYIMMIADRRSGGTASSLRSTALAIRDFDKNVTITGVTRQWGARLVDYLEKRYNGGSAKTIFAWVKVCLGEAVKVGLINSNPLQGLPSPRGKSAERCFLTSDEVSQLYITPCSNDEIKRAFLFSCYTGLRISDVRSLIWGEIIDRQDGLCIEKTQRKTGNNVYVEVNRIAQQLLGKRGESGDAVFKLPTKTTVQNTLKRWASSAGFEKKVTFHVARHTFATMLLTYGTDIYTVSKLLGHTNISTTQIYGKIIDEKRRDAVERLPNPDNEEK